MSSSVHAKAIIVLGARRKDSCATMEVPIEVSSLEFSYGPTKDADKARLVSCRTMAFIGAHITSSTALCISHCKEDINTFPMPLNRPTPLTVRIIVYQSAQSHDLRGHNHHLNLSGAFVGARLAAHIRGLGYSL